MATHDLTPPDPDDPLSHFTAEERALVVRFLGLIRDNYTKADKAAHFLERKAGVTNTCGITNLRDVLSHLATLLDPRTAPEKRGAQIASAEEHLRRAIIEPYEIGVATLTDKFRATYDTYREKVIPVRETDGFRTAPGRSQIDGRIADIDDSAEKGKLAKARNLWDDEWEQGVTGLIVAFDQLTDLHNEIEEWVFKFSQHQTAMEQAARAAENARLHNHGIKLHWVAIIAAVVGIFVGILATRYAPLFEVKSASPAQAVTSGARGTEADHH